MFGPTVAISVKVVLSGERSILKPSSLVALSVQVRLIWLAETAVAVRPVGAPGESRTGMSLAVRSSQEKVTGRLVVALPAEPNTPVGADTCRAAPEFVRIRCHADGSVVPSCQTFIRKVVGLMPSA